MDKLSRLLMRASDTMQHVVDYIDQTASSNDDPRLSNAMRWHQLADHAHALAVYHDKGWLSQAGQREAVRTLLEMKDAFGHADAKPALAVLSDMLRHKRQ